MDGLRKVAMSVLLLTIFQSGVAATLDEYGVSFTQNGLVDHVSNLKWLDAGLTQGGLDELQFWLDDGWRIASEADLYFLITRQHAEFGDTAELPLNVDDFMLMMTQLSIDPAVDSNSYGGPWVCRAYGDPQQNCVNTNSFGGQFIIDLSVDLEPVLLSLFVFITEVPIYGSLDCFDEPAICDYTGRSLLVRTIPLPAPLLLFFSALSLCAIRLRQRGSGSNP